MKQPSNLNTFRGWLQEMWMQHKDELAHFGQKCDYDVGHYFNKYKYWLKREFKHQRKQQS